MFQKYRSIDNLNSLKTFPGEFVVVEKVHGANFSFYCNSTNPDEVQVFNRTAQLDTLQKQKKFFNCVSVVEKIKPYLPTLYTYLGKPFTLYGELFGGLYNKTTEKGSFCVQRGVDYCPFNDFFAFDLKVGDYLVDFDTFTKAMEACKFPLYAKPLFRGSFEDASKWSNEHKEDLSTIPSFYNLQPLSAREGHVLKQVSEKEVGKGFIMFKDKGQKFTDKNNTKGQNDKNEDVYKEIQSYLTEARISSARSKSVDANEMKFGDLVREIYNDMVSDVLKDGLFPDLRSFEETRINNTTIKRLLKEDIRKFVMEKTKSQE